MMRGGARTSAAHRCRTDSITAQMRGSDQREGCICGNDRQGAEGEPPMETALIIDHSERVRCSTNASQRTTPRGRWRAVQTARLGRSRQKGSGEGREPRAEGRGCDEDADSSGHRRCEQITGSTLGRLRGDSRGSRLASVAPSRKAVPTPAQCVRLTLITSPVEWRSLGAALLRLSAAVRGMSAAV
jgi:hypothetical protein